MIFYRAVNKAIELASSFGTYPETSGKVNLHGQEKYFARRR
jgi:hypothetical protein